ncbi:sugar ABC transporter ATP-binding protein [Humisphaera borealis]|uniref:Sugar ABC transporter ATP-binding protein n=1 Tax=Humisphaera borealis TaxID=2807512 RepID=A0A7M2X1K8_9BACT|nr:sugar ABC transporter ATP-binding protein [Humisphaera borealis]QOV91636.1 sugar ABC transporter ATP-binding protein [Humisphaera borealis]
MGQPRLQMIGVHKRFGATAALAGVSLSVEPGQVLALVGENGAGKSTLTKVLSGAHQPDEGQMLLDGQAYTPGDPLAARRSGVAMIYQELSLAPHLTVAENILLGMEPTAGPMLRRGRMSRTATDALRQLGRPDIDIHRPAGELSIADQQLVEIARAIAVGCRVLVLDEPTSSLTARDIRLLFELVRRLKGRGIAVIYISHFLEEVREISDVFTVLRDGRSVSSGRTADTPTADIIRMMVGRDVADLYPRSPRTPGDEVLRIDHLHGDPRPIDATLSLRRGEVVGIAGVIGAGRTELLRAVFGLDRVRSGDVRVGVHSGPAAPVDRWAQGVGMVSEDRKTEGLALNLAIAENLTMSRLRNLGPLRLVLPSRQQQAAATWIDRLAIKCRSPGQPVGDLSGGNQQKVALARLLYHDVDVLLLDEPTRGIDVGSKAQIYRLIDELARGDAAARRPPKAILMVSSYLPELLGVCDRIAVMCRGRLGPARAVGEVNEHQVMQEATGAL